MKDQGSDFSIGKLHQNYMGTLLQNVFLEASVTHSSDIPLGEERYILNKYPSRLGMNRHKAYIP